MSKSVRLSLLLIMLACVGTTLMLRHVPYCHFVSKKELDHQPDAFMNNVNYSQYGDQGFVHSHLNTPLIVHYAYENSANFNHPDYLIYINKQVSWTVSANHGKSKGGGHLVYLWDHVKIHEFHQSTKPKITIVTHELTIFPNRSFAETNKSVIITQPNSTVQATGMTADLKKGIVHLLSHSLGIYEAVQ